MTNDCSLPSSLAFIRLVEGNRRYLNARSCSGDISPSIRLRTFTEGQSPFATVFTCSDSRVIPEAIFDSGIGDLFVVRTAGNTLSDSALGSVEYAVRHLGCPLVLVLGHTGCGAVTSAIEEESVTSAARAASAESVASVARDAHGENPHPGDSSVHPESSYIRFVTDGVRLAISGETDLSRAVVKNLNHTFRCLSDRLGLPAHLANDSTFGPGPCVCSALYDTSTGLVKFF